MGTRKRMGSFLNFFSDLNFSRHKLTDILLCIALFLIVPSNSNPESNSCDTATQFQCSRKFICIPLEYLCDGEVDCTDGSDEDTCPEGVTRSNRTGKINPQPYDVDSYSKVLKDPLNGTSLEFLMDYKEGEKDIVAMHSDFDPEAIMLLLVERARSTATPPNQFHWEIRQIISPEIGADQTYLEELLNKYKIIPKAENSESATLFRLRMMFPHYCNLGQKPYFSSPKINVAGSFEAPAMLQYPEFGGLIPSSDSDLSSENMYAYGGKSSKQLLIALHLYLLSRNREEIVPLRVRCLTLKERIEKSMLSDERRIRLLQNNHILTASNQVGGNFFCKSDINPRYQNYYGLYSCIPDIFHNGCESFL